MFDWLFLWENLLNGAWDACLRYTFYVIRFTFLINSFSCKLLIAKLLLAELFKFYKNS